MRNLISSLSIACLLLTVSCKDDEPAPPPAAVFEDQIIKELPSGTAVSLFTTPIITFNNGIGKPITVEGDVYQPMLDEIKFFKDASEITGTFVISADGKSGQFAPAELLPAESTIKVEVKVHWEVQLNGEWNTVTEGGNLSAQIKSANFTTGKYIAPSDIVIKQLPSSGSTAQSVITYPLVVFKSAFETPIISKDDNKSYRPVIDETLLLQGNQTVASTPIWNTKRDSLTIKPLAILQGQTVYSVQVKSHWEFQEGANWKAVTISGQIPYSVYTSSFTTAQPGDVTKLLTDNIAYTYPVDLQYFFLQDEYAKGYVIMKTGLQSNLVKVSGGEQLQARFNSPGKTEITSALQFDEPTLTLSYEMPSLVNQTIYHLQFIRISVGGNETEVYSTYFRTSKYNTFLQKMADFTNKKGYSWSTYTGVFEIKSQFENASESFDAAEIKTDSLSYPNYKGMYYGNGLFLFEAQAGVPFYDNSYNFLYKDLAASGLRISYRSEASVGIPPKNAIYLLQDKSQRISQLTTSQINSNSVTFAKPINVMIYNLNLIVDRDYWDLQSQALKHPDRETNPYMKKITSEYFLPIPTFTDYKVKIKYRIPGKNIITSEKEIIIDYKY